MAIPNPALFFCNKIMIVTSWAFCHRIWKWARGGVNAWKTRVSEVSAILIDGAASCAHQEKTTNTKSEKQQQ